ncbi:MAG: hypothetical protein GY868_08670 [Deltaproteobacteria bacterium]|nr:hypothetical protein [Deltaproteobacteria bacterium]
MKIKLQIDNAGLNLKQQNPNNKQIQNDNIKKAYRRQASKQQAGRQYLALNQLVNLIA